jgi:hypothetical protein
MLTWLASAIGSERPAGSPKPPSSIRAFFPMTKMISAHGETFAASISVMGHSLPRLPGLAPPDVRYASISDQNFAAPRLVAMGH